MTPRELLDRFWPLFQPRVKVISGWIAKHARRIALAGAVFLLALLTVAVYRQWNNEEIILYAGPPGSSGQRMASKIKNELEATDRVPGVPYRVRMELTEGFDAIEELILADQKGRCVGFALDSLVERDGINVLMPLDFDYLHILCSQRFIRDISRDNPSVPTQLSQIIHQLPEHSCLFAGPKGSGSRRLAELVLKMFGRDIDDMTNPSIDDWFEARSALKHGSIALAFYVGPYGATTINEIAKDNSSVLVGIRDIQKALVRQEEYALKADFFPANSYRAYSEPFTAKHAPGPTKRTAGWSGRDPKQVLPFCGDEVGTIAARRLVVCSRSMSNDNAYAIAGAVSKALSADSPLIGKWEVPSADLGTTPAEALSGKIGLTPHPGALLLSGNSPPWTWWRPWTWSAPWASAFITLLALVLQEAALSRRRRASADDNAELETEETSPNAAAPAVAPPQIAALPSTEISHSPQYLKAQQMIERFIDELPQKLSQNEWSGLRRKLMAYGERLRKKYVQGRFSAKEAATLAVGFHKCVQVLELVKPVTKAVRRKSG